ncbi:FAD-dependent oxidoreductase [Clostridium sp. PL3]|uniref:FAD-dependent oxidoreductase n=1 Tax=Clostridium thailandense TaxID=2794346 RepID=A0A949TSB3_9CLOT|nr:FAD-dependent oxidoreductase [Clostridium thailandense]MBV7275627.1 FAD-dependent oxidoreductase [Clostridium thailandense]
MNKKYKALFEPFKINKLEIKNKFFMAPMATPATCDVNGSYTYDSMEYYVERAKGGVGLIITGANWVESDIEKHMDAFFPEPTKVPNVYQKVAVEITDRVHAFDSKIFLQLTAGLGRSALPHALKGECVAPSPTKNRWIPDIDCRELTTKEVEKIVSQFAKSAKIAKDSGFDGVEIHAVHEGYLLDCFTMSFFNKRTDKYGGDLKGRLTFPIEVVQAIKSACGADFPVILRFSIKSYIKALRQGGLPGEEFEELGRDVSEALEAAKILEEAGYDAFDADAGTYDSWYWAHPPMYFEKGMYLPLTEQLKKVVKVPVMVAGRMENPDMAIKALEDGKLDAVGLGRQLLTDPEYPNKLRTDDAKNIRPCLGCHDGCFSRLIFQGGRGSCAVNPECGRELIVGITPAVKSKKVIVVGGGPAGMEAARVSALRGYKVILFEASDSLGGQLVIGGVPSFKEDDRALIRWYEHQMKALSVDVKLNTRATKESIKALNPDIVYIAEGSEPIKLKLPGIDNEKVVNASEVLSGKKKVGQKSVIVGGGLVGCELALHLRTNGHEVTILEAMEDILKSGAPMAPMNEWMLRDLLTFNKIELITGACLSEVTDKGAIVTLNGEKKVISADNIIIAVGFKAKNTLFEELKYEYGQIYNLGDGKKVRNIRAAIWDAYEVARSI